MTCPLCRENSAGPFDQEKRTYFQCHKCSLVFVPRNELISQDEEKSRYDSHNNAEDDAGYIAYLSGIRDEILPFIKSGSRGLDFGSGRTTLMEKLFREKGFELDSFDIYFRPREELLKNKYDFIIMSEVIEHLRMPFEDMIRIRSMLKPEGGLFVKTKLLPEEKSAFAGWYYKRDKTHVQFFTLHTFRKFEEILGLKFKKAVGEDLFLFGNN